MLQAVLTYSKPSEWEPVMMYDTTYKLFNLNPGDREYMAEVNPFVNGSPRMSVDTLNRVQNPFQLGRFLIRKEQKEFRRENADVVKYYHPVNKEDVEIALEYNLDVRRYTHPYSFGQNNDGKDPKLYKTPGMAAQVFAGMSAASNVILVCNVLGKSDDNILSVHRKNDAEFMPTYVVTLI